MKKRISLFAGLSFPVMVLGSILCSCEGTEQVGGNDVPEPPAPEVVINQTEYKLGIEGGIIQVDLSVSNAIDTLDFTVAHEADWLDVTAGSQNILLDVERNTAYEVRTAELTVSYGEYYTGTITVSQDGEIYPDYEVTIKEITATTIVMDVIPARDDFNYMIRPIRKDVLDTYASDEEFFAAELEYIQHMRENESTSLSSLVFNGPQTDYEALYLDADSEYVVCVYAIDSDMNLLSDIKKSETVKTNPVEITLEATATASSITVNMTSSDDKAPVFFGVISKKYLEENDKTLDDAIYWAKWFSFYAAKELWGRNTIDQIPVMSYFGSGSNEFTTYPMDDMFMSVLSDTDYIVWAITINQYGESGLAEPVTVEVKTEKTYLSDNVITVDISNVTSTSWDLQTTTTNDDPYVVYYHYKSEYEEYTDDELIEMFTTGNYNFALFYTKRGDYYSKYGNKTPDTEYTIFVFGFEGGVMTTEFQRIDVKTLPE